jgi:hypothetical protein
MEFIKRHEETVERVAFHDVLFTDMESWLLLAGVLCQMPKIHVFIDWAVAPRMGWDVCFKDSEKLHTLAWELSQISDLKDYDDKKRFRALLHRIKDWLLNG